MDRLIRAKGFQWDEGNIDKNWDKHRVSRLECEQPFFNDPLLVARDEQHSQLEERYYALGQTNAGRLLFIVFTLRNELIRVISAREMNKRERRIFERVKEEGA